MPVNARPLKLHAAQHRMLSDPARFKVASCGRRFGKTRLAGYWAAMAPGRSALAGYPVAWFAPTYKILLDAWGQFERNLKPVIKSVNKADRRMVLTTGGVVDFWTLEDEDAGRGRKYARIVIDEAAHARKLEQVWTRAILPTLSDLRGEAWLISTPRGGNYFKVLYDLGGKSPGWAAITAPTSANPRIHPDEIETQRLMLPARIFAQEFLAEFIADGAGVFRRVDRLESCEQLESGRAGFGYVIGADWGRSDDFTVFAVIELGTANVCAVDRFTDISYPVQSSRLKALRQRFNSAAIVAEANSMGLPIIEQLQRDGIPVEPFWTANATKAEAIESLALAIERGELRMLDSKVLRDELTAYDSERLPSGGVRYSAPPGKHDDCVMALALAWHGYRGAQSAPAILRRR